MTRFLYLCLFSLMLLPACATDKIDRFSEVHEGMSQDEVRAILGNPSSTYTREVDERGRVVRLSRWQYGDSPGTLATGALFSEHPSERVWAVYFGEDEKVLDVAEPNWETETREPVVPSTIPPRNQ
jgi:outer membrane protein assembly factor BamE (lipoprotein component of BamABCDE complex)